jgi:hypothetical protein
VKKKISFGLALASLVISGLALFSSLSKADVAILKTFTIQNPATARGNLTVQVKSIAVVYRSLKLEVKPFDFPGHGTITNVFIRLDSPSVVAETSSQALINKSVALSFTYISFIQGRFGTLAENAAFEKGAMHVAANEVNLQVDGANQNFEVFASQAYESKHSTASEGGFFADLNSYFVSTREAFREQPTVK